MLLVVVPFVGTNVLLETNWWFTQSVSVAVWTLGLSTLLGLVTWKMRAATPGAAAAGATINASLMYSTLTYPYEPLHTALIPTLAVSVLVVAATRIGRRKKEQLGTAEAKRGRGSSQIAANLGFAALVATSPVQSWLLDLRWMALPRHADGPLFALAVASLAEAAADTVSSEIGQVLGGRPRMITTFRAVDAGTDGAMSVAGTLVGFLAAGIVAVLGAWALRGGVVITAASWAGAVFGLIFDSLLGATVEKWGWLNNDMVNFVSTASAAGFALLVLVVWR